ncbi:MAG: hypothetical protein WA842_03885 [Croceibacterium sp.]
MDKKFTVTAAIALAGLAVPAAAQTSTTTTTQESQRDRIGQILGTLFGGRLGASATLESQWAAGRKPLADQRAQFETRVDTDVRAGTLSQATGARLKSDYYNLVQLEARYGADGRFTTQEQTELADGYGALTQALASGGTEFDNQPATTEVADGRVEFNRRVDAAVAARRLTRTAGTTLKNDYAALVRIEAGYIRDGQISAAERSDLDARLDALDVRVGDTVYGSGTAVLTPRQRLDAIAAALTRNGLGTSAVAQLRVEHGDLSRLEAAYARLSVTAADRAYLDQRLTDLETRARLR